MKPHQVTIEVLDAFGAVAGTAIVKWADVKWNFGAIDEVHRVFDQPVRVAVPAGINDPRMVWSLRATLAGTG